ncbi:MAG: hypothetical protein A2546_00010 [Sphingobacteriia bacterium RIFOXYD2_FULL_35_12]|nr:MAG: hypothetical protein A2472_13745 [Sphingobacteriia bacterium RIFOXYC2_FULL_35_18]OHC87611.1 MAG: hypothetical protein A2546_00010 [Sphingobacteriia bacterium RIFOXYD2_FULL_35_12]
MGFQLWYSQHTGLRRRGTTFSEIHGLFVDKITTHHIYEPLLCCRSSDNLIDVKETLVERDFDVLGVIDDKMKVIGYVHNNNLIHDSLTANTLPIDVNQIISDSTPLAKLIEILSKNDFAFVLSHNNITGIVTKADLNKPIIRIYLFGLVSLFELHLNFWIDKSHPAEAWKELLQNERLQAAEKLHAERKGNNIQLTLLECLQIADKKDILRKTSTFLVTFKYSKSKFKNLLEDVATLRNELAHSQNSIISNLSWEEFVNTIDLIKDFLLISDEIVEQ